MSTGLLYIVPLLALLAALMAGCYPGEALLRSAIARRRVTPRAPRSTARRPLFLSFVPRGGALVGHALAGRAPPSGPRPA